ncbi:zinc ribbon domain-containing protein [Intestinimonas butyriciproducens]|nr:zinc ribbon domain-containing protein [Intestinimonas butyriciproducens]MDB7815910.1 zinc ribbon domain-containing protein [Intestinimonas butyriciproducens]MDB7856932.1 zinc ribbon domain-containing protein [Intestinimonas butyriciproducens]
MQKSGKTELGKYSAKYALTELLVCGECGSPYKRVTWARNGKKQIVWRCVSRLEFGRKYCHSSPTLAEEKLHRAILEALNEFAQAGTEVKADLLEFTAMAWSSGKSDGTSLITLRQRLKDINAQQALLLDQVLEHMDDSILTAQLKAIMDEKQATQEQISALKLDSVRSASQASRMAELKEWMARLEVNTEYQDEQVRMAIEKITVLDAETIRIKFKYPGLEIQKKLV